MIRYLLAFILFLSFPFSDLIAQDDFVQKVHDYYNSATRYNSMQNNFHGNYMDQVVINSDTIRIMSLQEFDIEDYGLSQSRKQNLSDDYVILNQYDEVKGKLRFGLSKKSKTGSYYVDQIHVGNKYYSFSIDGFCFMIEETYEPLTEENLKEQAKLKNVLFFDKEEYNQGFKRTRNIDYSNFKDGNGSITYRYGDMFTTDAYEDGDLKLATSYIQFKKRQRILQYWYLNMDELIYEMRFKKNRLSVVEYYFSIDNAEELIIFSFRKGKLKDLSIDGIHDNQVLKNLDKVKITSTDFYDIKSQLESFIQNELNEKKNLNIPIAK